MRACVFAWCALVSPAMFVVATERACVHARAVRVCVCASCRPAVCLKHSSINPSLSIGLVHLQFSVSGLAGWCVGDVCHVLRRSSHPQNAGHAQQGGFIEKPGGVVAAPAAAAAEARGRADSGGEEHAGLHADVFYLPQKPYSVLGTIFDQLTYVCMSARACLVLSA